MGESSSDAQAWRRARAIGAVHEAERLDRSVVGTEHLLLAATADPVVRWAFRTVGVDAADIRAEVARTADRRRGRRARDGITVRATNAVMAASADVDDLDGDQPGLDQVSRVLRALACRFLVRTKHSAARDVLDGLGLLQHRSRLMLIIEQNATGARRPRQADELRGADGGTPRPRRADAARGRFATAGLDDPSA